MSIFTYFQAFAPNLVPQFLQLHYFSVFAFFPRFSLFLSSNLVTYKSNYNVSFNQIPEMVTTFILSSLCQF